MGLWKWSTDPDLRRKSCYGCRKPMFTDIASAIEYQGNIYHEHCLIDFLTEQHSGSLQLASGTDCGDWGNTP